MIEESRLVLVINNVNDFFATGRYKGVAGDLSCSQSSPVENCASSIALTFEHQPLLQSACQSLSTGTRTVTSTFDGGSRAPIMRSSEPESEMIPLVVDVDDSGGAAREATTPSAADDDAAADVDVDAVSTRCGAQVNVTQRATLVTVGTLLVVFVCMASTGARTHACMRPVTRGRAASHTALPLFQ